MRQSRMLQQVCQWMVTTTCQTIARIRQQVTPWLHQRREREPQPTPSPTTASAPSAAPAAGTVQFSPRASLVALGTLLRHQNLFGPVHELVCIPQKTVKHAPTAKLEDAFITMLAGGQGIADINTHLRCDPVLSRAFGRTACADQSTVQRTLDACTDDQVQQMEHAVDRIIRRYSRAYRHDYTQGWLLLDVDMTGLPCGPTAVGATRGYFAHQRNRRGRQLGRVLATDYGEVLVDHVVAGNHQLPQTMGTLLDTTARRLHLDAEQRRGVLVRADSGGGGTATINALLTQGYQILVKDYSSRRARALGLTVATWIDDPHHPGRQVGWVVEPPTAYVRPVRRIAVRCRKRNRQWSTSVLITTLSPTEILRLTGRQWRSAAHDTDALLALVALYDQRGGALETVNKGDKQGLGIGLRNKRQLPAQQMVVLLALLAHNVTVWSHHWLRDAEPKLHRYGIKRMIREVLQISGTIAMTSAGTIASIQLNRWHPLARGMVDGLAALLQPTDVAVTMGGG